jgi:queuine tRNA-ribosyltransferase
MTFKFEIIKKSKTSKARVGKLHTPHGVVNTPVFLPVGTLGAVKTMSPRNLEEIGTEMVLSNTYHLLLRPGPELIKHAGGLHKFMNWDKPILTDSGGFQVFSLAHMRKVRENGVEFTSHVDGAKHFLTPDSVLDVQKAFGSDIMMPLDECVAYPCDRKAAKKALERTTAWAKQSKKRLKDLAPSVVFGIVQGSTYKDLRQESAKQIGGSRGGRTFLTASFPLGWPGTALF